MKKEKRKKKKAFEIDDTRIEFCIACRVGFEIWVVQTCLEFGYSLIIKY